MKYDPIIFKCRKEKLYYQLPLIYGEKNYKIRVQIEINGNLIELPCINEDPSNIIETPSSYSLFGNSIIFNTVPDNEYIIKISFILNKII